MNESTAHVKDTTVHMDSSQKAIAELVDFDVFNIGGLIYYS